MGKYHQKDEKRFFSLRNVLLHLLYFLFQHHNERLKWPYRYNKSFLNGILFFGANFPCNDRVKTLYKNGKHGKNISISFFYFKKVRLWNHTYLFNSAFWNAWLWYFWATLHTSLWLYHEKYRGLLLIKDTLFLFFGWEGVYKKVQFWILAVDFLSAKDPIIRVMPKKAQMWRNCRKTKIKLFLIEKFFSIYQKGASKEASTVWSQNQTRFPNLIQ